MGNIKRSCLLFGNIFYILFKNVRSNVLYTNYMLGLCWYSYDSVFTFFSSVVLTHIASILRRYCDQIDFFSLSIILFLPHSCVVLLHPRFVIIILKTLVQARLASMAGKYSCHEFYPYESGKSYQNLNEKC